MYKITDKTYFTNVAEICRNMLLLNYTRGVNRERVPLKAVVDNLPFVVLIGGEGGSGKSTFTDLCNDVQVPVYEFSTIDCCKQLSTIMCNLEYQFSCDDDYFRNQIDSKSDSYRYLLHSLKSAWCEFDNGPNKIVIQKVVSCMEGDSNPFLIFINVREPDQIDILKSMLLEVGYIPITLCVHRSDVENWSNEGDRTTNNYDYDIVIENNGSLGDLNQKALDFCYAVRKTSIRIPTALGSVLESTLQQ